MTRGDRLRSRPATHARRCAAPSCTALRLHRASWWRSIHPCCALCLSARHQTRHRLSYLLPNSRHVPRLALVSLRADRLLLQTPRRHDGLRRLRRFRGQARVQADRRGVQHVVSSQARRTVTAAAPPGAAAAAGHVAAAAGAGAGGGGARRLRRPRLLPPLLPSARCGRRPLRPFPPPL